MNTLISLAAGAVILSAGAASAATTEYTFQFGNNDFGHGSGDHASIAVSSVEDAAFSVTLDAFYYNTGAATFSTTGDADVDFNYWGIVSKNGAYDHHYIDSKDAEAVTFDFGSNAVKITEVVLNYVFGYNDMAMVALYADGALHSTQIVGDPVTLDYSAAGEHSLFAIGAMNYGNYYTGIKIQSMKV